MFLTDILLDITVYPYAFYVFYFIYIYIYIYYVSRCSVYYILLIVYDIPEVL